MTCVQCSCACNQAEDAAPQTTLNTVFYSYLTYPILLCMYLLQIINKDVHCVLRSLIFHYDLIEVNQVAGL